MSHLEIRYAPNYWVKGNQQHNVHAQPELVKDHQQHNIEVGKRVNPQQDHLIVVKLHIIHR